jgi:hypothetical protein
MAISDERFRRLNLRNVQRAPRKRGVYALYADRVLLYLGMAGGGEDTIRSRLRTHLGGQAHGATRYKREPSPEPQVRLQVLLDEYASRYGCLPAQNVGAS